MHQSKAVSDYAENVANLKNGKYKEIMEHAKQYNASLRDRKNRYHMTKEEIEEYESVLNLNGTGVLGYIEIPAIHCSLPIYHGIDDTVLQVAIGHIAWSSLPIGGEGTHAVLSGHRGLPSAKLFSDLDKLTEGDTFIIRVLDETLTYEIDQIHIVLPDELDFLQIEEGQDLCTLVTCTPYGINSHRLLVRGHRVENQKDVDAIRVTADAMQIEPVIMAPFVAMPMLLILFLWLLFSTRRR